VLALFFWGGFYDLFFSPQLFFNPREISVGAFSGVENAKMWGPSPEMPKTGSPLAKGELWELPWFDSPGHVFALEALQSALASTAIFTNTPSW
jgi:hypothetical protein